MRTAMDNLQSAIKALEQKVAEGHISDDEAQDAIAKLRQTHEILNRLEAKLDARTDKNNSKLV